MNVLKMSSESGQKSKKALTTLVGLFLVCLISECVVVDGKSVRKATPTEVIIPTKDNPYHYSRDTIFPFQVISNDGSLSTYANKVVESNGGHDQLLGSTLFENLLKSDADSGYIKLARSKRSPYPPGFVAWSWREPCFCPPGQFFSCRCNYSTTSASSEENKNRKRRSRSGRKHKKS